VARDSWWVPARDGAAITISVRVTPGARRSELVAITSDRMRVRVGARAVEGKANAELERFVAELFGVRPSAVAVVRGGTAREKVLRVEGIAAPPPGLLAAVTNES
jgi:uncharacterized protein (TIGR00251 family)